MRAAPMLLLCAASISAGCGESHGVEMPGPWLESELFGHFDGGEVRQATCEGLGLERIHIRVEALYDLEPEAIDDEVQCSLSFDVDRSIFDGELHPIRGSIDLPDFARDADAEGVVFTPEEGHDPAIVRAVAIPWMIFDAPSGTLQLSGELRLEEPCPSGSIQVAVEGEGWRLGRTETFLPIAPTP